ncbi:MAG: tetratricopeptide repeat protein [Gammaproteobacteria bacterium]
MNNAQHITDVTNETFDSIVIEQSRRVPVLVDYWADWCGPCQMQMPVLKKLVEDYDGKFVLAKVNTDEQRELARAHGIRSLPTMRVYKHGEMVEEILAAQSEATLRILLDRHIERESDAIRERAMAAWQQGKHSEALSMLQDAHLAEPDNHQLTLAYAELKMRQGLLDDAAALIASLPHDVRNEKEAARLGALLEFALVTRDAPPVAELESAVDNNPDDLEARYQLAACYVLNNQMEPALEAFMQVLQRNRAFRDDAGRKGLLAVFELLENEGELVNSYRRKLFTLLH